MSLEPSSFFDVDHRLLVDILQDQIALVNADGIIWYVNAHWQRFEPWGAGNTWLNLAFLPTYHQVTGASPEGMAALESALLTVLSSRSTHTSCTISVDTPVRRWIQVTITAYDQGSERGAMIQQHDISAHYYTQAELQQEQEFTRVLLDNLADGVVACNADGHLILFNQAARQWHNLDPDEALAPEKWADKYNLYEADGKTPLAVGGIPLIRAFNGESLRQVGMAIAAHSQPLRFIEASGAPLHDRSGRKVGAVVVMHDVTARKEAEEARLALQETIIHSQQEILEQLSTPLFPINQFVMLMPLIGTIDSRRAQQMVNSLLQGVAQHRTQFVILDITGVSLVDTQVANVFIHAAQAVRLLGAQIVITGIRPEVAQTMVDLGIDLGAIITRGTLASGIDYTFKKVAQ
ncbi:MAG TPA: PAS domain-containing protein [Herpetosiphonaceae bacterium]|nr:PAS domain-containing protein [Herpetosiphonaceae bacterium]